MPNSKVIEVDLRVNKGVLVVDMSDAIAALKKVASDFEGIINDAFASGADCLQSTTTAVNSLSEAVTGATTEIQNLVNLLTKQYDVAAWDELVSSGVDLVAIIFEMYTISSTLLGIFGSLSASVTAQAGAWASLNAMYSASSSVINALGVVLKFFASSVGKFTVIAIIVATVAVAIIKNWDTIKAAIGTAAEWLNTNVIQPIVGFCTSLWNSITTIATNIWNGIVEVFSAVAQWFYDHVVSPLMDIFSPIVEWYSELFQSVWQTIFDVFYNIGVIITGCWDVIAAVWGLVAEWFNSKVIQPVARFFSGLWSGITGFAASAWTAIQSTFQAVGAWFNTNVVQPVAGFFAGLWNGFKQAAVSAWEGVKSVFSTVASFFGDIFGKAWAGVVKVFSAAGNVFNNIKDGILTVFRSIVNGLIDGINAVVAIPFRGLNSALTFVRSVEIAGIRPFSGLRTLSIPQIPHLARGAVLPANKPFLAVVGDQHHGTNVEAPLATIQEAVRSEVGEMMAVMVTSLDALLRENRALRRTVEGISVGDEVIGRAAQRYEQRMAVIGGTY